MNKVAIIIKNAKNKLNVIEALNYYVLSNKHFLFDVYDDVTTAVKAHLTKHEQLAFKLIDSSKDYKDLLDENYDFIINFDETYNNDLVDSINAYLFEVDDKKSLIIKAKNDDEFFTKFDALIAKFKNDTSFSPTIKYIDSYAYFDDMLIKKLEEYESYIGKGEIKNLFVSFSDIILIKENVIDIITDCFNAFKNEATKNKGKSLGSYFSKMFTNFAKEEKLSLSSNFYNNKIVVNEKNKILFLSSDENLSQLIYIFKSLKEFTKY